MMEVNVGWGSGRISDPLVPADNWHVTEIRPFGVNPCPRRRVGCAKVGSQILICGGTSPIPVIRDGREREILHDHNDVFILHLGNIECVYIIVRW